MVVVALVFLLVVPGLIAIAGTCFYFMIKALARIQMPERDNRRQAPR